MERMGTIMRNHLTFSRGARAAAILLALAAATPARAQTFSEPATIFYGKVVGVGSAQPFVIHEGALSWTIQRADGQEITLTTTLFSFQGGTLSYRLEVPHAALGLGLTAGGGIPLPPAPETHLHKLVKVDGETATLLGPASAAFTSEQLARTATYRMDLALGRVATDTDGDGIADWWETLHGLDLQNPGDAGVDANGDGITALQAYRQGLDPNHDYRNPELLTEELVVYPAGTTALQLEVMDLDSAPSNLTFTLASLPAAGTLTLRNAQTNPAAPEVALALGDTFTQADLLKGRVVYDQPGVGAQHSTLTVVVRDENPASPASTGVVSLLAYAPADLLPALIPAAELRRFDHHLLAADGLVVADGAGLATNRTLAAPSAGLSGIELDAYLAAFGPDRAYALADGAGAETLRGGHQADVLLTDAGHDVLNGGAGADQFVFRTFNEGRKTVEDFQTAELDVLDLSRLPAAPGAFVHNALRLAVSGGVYRLQVDLDANGAGFTNLSIALPGLTAGEADLYSLVESGRLLVGGLVLQPRITVAATTPQASENGPASGVFTLTRSGSLDDELTVGLALSGSALNGTDYAFVPSSVTIPAGQATATVTIQPFADSSTEPAELVELLVQPGSGYRVGTADRASLTIEDLLMLVEISVLEPVAVKDTLSPATFLISRRDVLNRDVVVRLKIGGTAANGADYNSLSTFVLMPANSSAALVQVTPKPTANLAGGMETVTLSINTDAAYRVTGNATAQVAIIERIDTFAAWSAREAAAGSSNLVEFAQAAPGGVGVVNLDRYAFGLGPDAANLAGHPRPFVHEGRLGVTFRKPLGVSDVTYRVTAAAHLQDWAGSALPLVEIPAPAGSSDPQQVYYVIDVASDADQPAFLMVEVEWLP
jgi:hypothetical protein